MNISAVVIAAILATVTSSAHSAVHQDSPATLSFNSQTQVLDGYVYGIDAIDGQEFGFGQKLSAAVAAGHRTVQYSCPSSHNGSGKSSLAFDFLPGRKYQLVCNTGADAEIQPADC
ncbi:MAG TPA: hypothetical protein VLK26_11760 [Rudaea sp.]|nr:hypothetical protein [Rudaea sp.]